MIKGEPEPYADAGSGGMAFPVLSEVAVAAPNRGVAALKYSAHAVDPLRVSMGIDIQGLKGCAGCTSGMSAPLRKPTRRGARRSPPRTPNRGQAHEHRLPDGRGQVQLYSQ